MAHFNNSEEEKHYYLFIRKDERGLKYFHDILSGPLLVYAKSRIDDKFASESIIQEVFLKAWERREKMQSAADIRDFIRRGVQWMCDAYLESKEGNASWIKKELEAGDENVHGNANNWRTELQDLLEKMLPRLEKNRQTLLDLYKQWKFARLVGKSYQLIMREVKDSIDTVKLFIDRLKQAGDSISVCPVSAVSDYAIYLSPNQLKVLTLYYDAELNLDRIAKEMNLKPAQVSRLFKEGKKIIVQASRHKRR